ncbi:MULTISPECIES: hypothetical protein [unclassified Nocardioides]|uniref:hypothetical protein n=1 Tax=unclassified Nocardioides TaxID=2615069 RepID=UPI00301543A5
MLALVGFDQFVEVDRPTAQSLLDVLAETAHTAMLVGDPLDRAGHSPAIRGWSWWVARCRRGTPRVGSEGRRRAAGTSS